MSEQLSQRIERDVRQLIGDLHMQIIVMRAMVDLSQQPPQPQPGEPAPQPQPGEQQPHPAPVPPQPQPAPPPQAAHRANGATPLRG